VGAPCPQRTQAMYPYQPQPSPHAGEGVAVPPPCTGKLYQSHGQSSQIAARAESPHSLPSPPLSRGERVGVRGDSKPTRLQTLAWRLVLGGEMSKNQRKGTNTNRQSRVHKCPPPLGSPRFARGTKPRACSVPPAGRGNLKEGVAITAIFCELWLCNWYNYAASRCNASRATRLSGSYSSTCW
jgi:hypothetical protein